MLIGVSNQGRERERVSGYLCDVVLTTGINVQQICYSSRFVCVCACANYVKTIRLHCSMCVCHPSVKWNDALVQREKKVTVT